MRLVTALTHLQILRSSSSRCSSRVSASVLQSTTTLSPGPFPWNFQHISNMSSFTLKEYGGIPVSLPDGLSEEQVLKFKPFNSWVQSLTKSLALQSSNKSHPFHSSPYTLRSVTVQAYDIFRPGEVGFLKIQSEVKNEGGEWLPGAVFLRGPSVAMLVILAPEDDPEDRHVLMTVQPRVAAGSLAFCELPAGMMDGQGEFAGQAAQEIKEELGMTIAAEDLINLSALAGRGGPGDPSDEEALPDAMFPSPGACDEHITIFAHERVVPRDQMYEFSGKLTGLRDEGERITLKLVKMKDLWREGARDGKTLAALALWEGLKREGKL